jgi:ribose transport system ATP-binding protein
VTDPSSCSSKPVETPSEPLLSVCGITKQFSGTLALDRVNFALEAGEIHALVGENGAGKSTLIKILAGVYAADSGEILVKGRPLAAYTEPPISFIHQDLGLVGSMTVAENIAVVAGYPRPHGLISWREAHERARAILASMGSDVDPGERVASLSSADQALVAIARSLGVAADILILDEPTASLPMADVERLFHTLRILRSQGMGIVFVTHRLDEVLRLADRVTVIRDGRKVTTTAMADTTLGELIYHIVGRNLSDMFGTSPPPETEPLLEVRDLRIADIGPIDLRLHRGEILGLVGLRGAGQDAVGRALFGVTSGWTGTMRIASEELDPGDPAQAMRRGVGFVSGKRAEESLAASLTVRENIYPNPIVLGIRPLGFLAKRDEQRRVRRAIERVDVRPSDPERSIGMLSGGNQQKVVLARWLEAESTLLVLEEPTTGVDVGSKAEIYRLLRQYVANGRSILVVSSDFEEVAGFCHRALVLRHGQIVAEVPRTELSVRRLTELAAGAAGDTTDGKAA